MKFISIFLLMISTVFSHALVFGQETTVTTSASTNTDSKVSMILPVNVMNENRINLTVNIPEDFKALGELGAGLMEFVPKKDTHPYAWSEIITVYPYIGQKLSAKTIVFKISQGIKQAGKEAKVLDEKYYSKYGYEEGYAILVYNNNARREVVKIYAASGPFDSVMVQKAVLINSDKDLDEAKRNLVNYFIKNVYIFDSK